MKLKQFLESYDVFYKDDYEAIVGWASYNGCQPELIGYISALAKSMAEDKKALDYQIHEWCNYAMNLVPAITEETDFTTCINALRLIYFAYNGKQYVEAVDYVLRSKNIAFETVADMHPMIIMKYNQVKEQYEEEV